jgi:hypothetical protein
MYYMTSNDETLLYMIDTYPRFAFLHFFRNAPQWANPLNSNIVVKVEFMKSYNVEDEIREGDVILIGQKHYRYHFANRNIVILRIFANPTYHVLTDYVKYTPYDNVYEWVNDFCSKISYHHFKSITYMCIHYGKRKPHKHRKRHLFLFLAEKYIPWMV